jgi:predicted short-subunit dehydrogenase-like oxidoreductase (DUF2520 family)
MKKGSLNITFIGAGKLATQLATALHMAGFTINEIYSRNLVTAQKLASLIKGSNAIDTLNLGKSKADLFIIGVPDDAITEIASKISLPESTFVVHTSGNTTLQALKRANRISGVFYPLQTFSINKKVDFSKVHICIEADNEVLKNILLTIGGGISQSVFEVNTEKRKKLHLAAVFACNFNNYLLSISEEIIKGAGLPFNILQPLVTETIDKAFAMGTKTAQTGPAVRNDINTINEHLNLLKDNLKYMEIYKQLTNNISGKYHKKSPLE